MPHENKFERKLNPPKGVLRTDKSGNPITYKIGSPMPVNPPDSYSYTFLSGMDMRFFATKEMSDDSFEEIGSVQGVSWKSSNFHTTSDGSLRFEDVSMDMLMLFGSHHIPPPKGHTARFRLAGTNKYGQGINILFNNFDPKVEASGGVAVDDLLLEIKYTFEHGVALISFVNPIVEQKDE